MLFIINFKLVELEMLQGQISSKDKSGKVQIPRGDPIQCDRIEKLENKNSSEFIYVPSNICKKIQALATDILKRQPGINGFRSEFWSS